MGIPEEFSFAGPDGLGTSIKTGWADALLASSDGNIYFSDTATRLRKYDPTSGMVTTIAGNGLEQYLNGTGTAAEFESMNAITQDSSGNWYVEDSNMVREINATSLVVSDFSGVNPTVKSSANDGPALLANFGNQMGSVQDAAGNIYVADSLYNVIRKLTPGGVMSDFAGVESDFCSTHTDGSAITATFCFGNEGAGIAIDSAQNLYVTDGSLVREVAPDGTVSTIAGTGAFGATDGAALSATFGTLVAVAIDSSGNLFVADYDNNLIRKISSSGTVSTFAGAGSTSLNHPTGVAVDLFNYVYISENGNAVIDELPPDGSYMAVLAGLLGNTGNTDGSRSVAQFNQPAGIAVDLSGNVYVSDFGNKSIRKVTWTGQVTTLTGTATGTSASGRGIDGTFTAASFYGPWGMTLGADNQLIVTDYTSTYPYFGSWIRLLQL